MPAAPAPDVRPPASVLYSDYIAGQPGEPELEYGSRSATAMMAAAHALRTGLSEPVRSRLLLALRDSAPSIVRGVYSPAGEPSGEGMGLIVDVVAARLARAWGELSMEVQGTRAWDEMMEVIVHGPDPRVLDVAGAWLDAYARIPGQRWLQVSEEAFASRLDEVLAETAYARRGRDVVRRRDARSAPAVEQPLRAFMTDNPRFALVDFKLAEAFAELNAGKGADAITDAATALQLLFNELGFTGNTLGAQITSARKGGLFTGIDTPLGESLISLSTWVASIRNQRGDAHPGAEPDLSDAELAVRVVALLVIRLGI